MVILSGGRKPGIEGSVFLHARGRILRLRYAPLRMTSKRVEAVIAPTKLWILIISRVRDTISLRNLDLAN